MATDKKDAVKTAAKPGWSKFWGNMAKLIDVKSIVTLSLVMVLCFVTLRQMPTPELFSSAVMLVLGFFFGKNTAAGTETTTAAMAATPCPYAPKTTETPADTE